MWRFFPSIFFSVALVQGLEWRYHNNTELETYLVNFAKTTHGGLSARHYSIGKTHKGYDLTVVEMTAVKKAKIGIPNIKLIGTIHGNEPVGRELILHFMEYLRKNYKSNLAITWLLDNARIHFLPNLNPEGFALASEDICSSENGRKNGNTGEDLNRNFPDYFHNNRYPEQPETKAIKKWLSDIPFVLSAALHGGALVANYPFDSIKEMSSDSKHHSSLTPDNDVFVHLAEVYTKNHLTMHSGGECNGLKFEGGMTNGAAWLVVIGGMQDYNYAFHGCMELTLEISCCKYPKANQLPKLWEENKTALLKYCLEALKGVTGQIVDSSTSKSIANASLQISGRNISFYTTKTGEFWRLLLPGHYKLQVSAQGYYDKVIPFEVRSYNESMPQLTVLKIGLLNSSVSTTTEQITTESEKKLSDKMEDGASTEDLFTIGLVSRNTDRPTPAGLVVASSEEKLLPFYQVYLVFISTLVAVF